MTKFIYCFTEEDCKMLLSEGYEFICECNMGKRAFVFKNNPKSLQFSDDKKKRLIFENKMYF